MPDFPANPSSGEIFEVASGVYRWDGTKWTLLEQPEEIGVPWLVANPVGSNGVKAIPPMFDANAYLSPPLMMEQIWNEISGGGGGGGGVSSFNTRTGAVTLTTADVTGAGGAPLASPTFTGVPAGPTATTGTNTTQLATTAFVQAQIAVVPGGVSSFNTRTGAVTFQASDISAVGGALLASPAFSGTPAAPTPLAADSSTTLATTAFVKAQSYLTGNQAITLSGDISGSGSTSITTALAVVNGNVGTFQGLTVNAKGLVTAAANQNYAPLASPALTGAPTAPTQAHGTNNTNIATTAFVAAAVAPAGASGSVQYNNGPVLGGAANFSIDANGNPFVNAGGQYGLGTYTAISGIPASTDWFFGSAGNSTVTGSSNVGIGPSALSGVTSGSSNTAVGVQACSFNTTGSYNVAIGLNALYANTTGSENTAIGYGALQSSITSTNTAIGCQALTAASGGGNTAVGYQAAVATTGSSNAAFGTNALITNTTGSSNAAIGYQSLNSNTTGTSNVAVGLNAMYSNTSGSYGVAVGYSALFNSTAGSQTAVGYYALYSNTTGSGNTAVGYQAGSNIATGSNNTMLGDSTGGTLTTGGGNICIGHNIDVPTSSTSNYLNIGGCIKGDMSVGPIAISKAVNFAGSIGVNGTTAPAKPTVSGAKGSNAALGSLIAALVAYGLITDTTTA